MLVISMLIQKRFDQMKSSGTLKLIHPRSLLDSLGLYYVTFQLLIKQDDLVRLKQDEVHKGNYALFNTYVFLANAKWCLTVLTGRMLIVEPPSGHPALLSTDYKTVNAVALNYYYLAAPVKSLIVVVLKTQKNLALKLIGLIKKEYHLKK